MSISEIRNPWLRRSVLLAATIPIALLTPIVGAAWGAWQWMKDFGGAWVAAWRGMP
jgi:hypothetical protein